MKRLHRADLYGWSAFNADRNLDFHSVLWVRDGGNVVIDPLPLSDHDRAHLETFGSVATIVITNSDHLREAVSLSKATGAKVLGPAGERDAGMPCDGWLADGDEVVPGLRVVALDGSKTPGELALVLERTTLITGDLVRAHEGGVLCMLPEPKLEDVEKARRSVQRLADLPGLETVLPGDGWPIFRHGGRALAELAYPNGRQTAERAFPVVRVVGRSGSGKTTVVSELIAHWKKAGLRVGAVKHASKAFTLDHPGKDTFRFRAAGADAVAIGSPKEWAIMASGNEPSTVDALLAQLPSDLDVALVEGFKGQGGMCVEVHRGSGPLLSDELALVGRIALVTDTAGAHGAQVPELDISNIAGIASFLEEAAGIPARNKE